MNLLLLLLVARAEAVVPVRLPEGESRALWSEALSLAGLGVGAPADGPWVEVTASGATWTLRVRDRAGTVHETRVAAPTTAQDREDLAMLAASLLQPLAVNPVKAPVAVTPPPVKAPPKPPPVVVPPPEPEPEPVPEPPPPEPEPVPVPPPLPPSHAEVRAGLSAELRPGATPTALAWFEAQWVPAGALRPVVGFGGGLPASLPLLETDVRYWTADAWIGATYAALVPVRFDVSLLGGVALRPFTQDGAPAGTAVVPTLNTRVEAPLALSPGLSVEPGVAFQMDLLEVDLRYETVGTVRFGDWAVRLSLGFRPTGKK